MKCHETCNGLLVVQMLGNRVHLQFIQLFLGLKKNVKGRS